MFIGFANFYQRFLQDFSKNAVSLISLLKTTGLFEKLASKAFGVDDNKVVSGGDGKTNGMVVNLSKNKKSKKLTHVSNIGATRKPNFLIPDTKKAFNHLRLALIKALIL